MKRFLSILLLLTSLSAFANDGIYYTSGNFLVPLRESTVSVRKEILTITIGRDNRARVDVYYEFYNPDSTKRVAMAFEAAAPDNAPFDITKSTAHPYIHDFKVVMNDEPLTYRNALILSRWENGSKVIGRDITLLDLTEWKHSLPEKYSDLDMPGVLYNPRLDSIIYADFGYMFEATFRPGLNIVRHTYSYDMSVSIGYRYSVHYWLTPATRWANRQIDDFTLRIRNGNDMDFFVGNDSLFSASPFAFSEGFGGVFPFTDRYGLHNTLIVTGGGDAVVEWHAENFAPESDMSLYSIDYHLPSLSPYLGTRESEVVVTSDGMRYRYIGDSGDYYLVEGQDYGLIPKKDARVETFSAEKGQGIVTIKNREYKRVNIRKEPTVRSRVVLSVRDRRGELPVVMRCLGLTPMRDDDGYSWFKVEVNGKTGYVREDLVMWDAIDSY